MRQMGSILPEELTNIDSFNPETPAIVQKALKRLERNISQNKYDTHYYQSMVLKCTHLDSSQQDKLLELFSAYASLFDGSLGKVPNIKVHLDLKPNSKPFCARAYKIPNHIIDIARKEVEELCHLGVLQAEGSTLLVLCQKEWWSPFHHRLKIP
jgi:hypothetical protein